MKKPWRNISNVNLIVLRIMCIISKRRFLRYGVIALCVFFIFMQSSTSFECFATKTWGYSRSLREATVALQRRPFDKALGTSQMFIETLADENHARRLLRRRLTIWIIRLWPSVSSEIIDLCIPLCIAEVYRCLSKTETWIKIRIRSNIKIMNHHTRPRQCEGES